MGSKEKDKKKVNDDGKVSGKTSEKSIDYSEAGLKCGVEIHQRLGTDKLFCSCPSVLREDEPDFTVRRELRAVAGETGEIDIAARHEKEKEVYFLYEGYNDTTCLVELDEEPPHPMDTDALKVVLQVCKMLDARVIDEIQVMRKTVTNGSNTSGFQRTALVGMGGKLETPEGTIGIPNIQIEEEAAKDVCKGVDKEGRRYVVFRLDRLGIPLIELGTDPDIRSPEQCREVCERIGMILRSTGKVARGIGTIRQDINISVAEGDRIEIKGAQDLKTIPLWVEYEVRRQLSLIDVASKVKDVPVPTVEIVDLTSVFSSTECNFVRKAVEKNQSVLGVVLPGLKGVLGVEVCPGRRVGSELSDYAKVKAGVGGIIHSDEDLSKYRFSDEEISRTEELLGCSAGDAFVLVVAKKAKAEKALVEAVSRAARLKEGVIREVRKANPDGTTSYMRPMPGASRMYPETDIPPITPDVSGIDLPELLEHRAERYQKEFGLSPDLAKALTRSDKFILFEDFVDRFKHVKPAFVAETLVSTPKVIKRKYKLDAETIDDRHFEDIFSRLDSGDLTKDAVEDILVRFAEGKDVDYQEYAPLCDEDLEAEINRILKESKEIEFNAVVGRVMGTLKGRAEGKKIIGMLKRLTSD